MLKDGFAFGTYHVPSNSNSNVANYNAPSMLPIEFNDQVSFVVLENDKIDSPLSTFNSSLKIAIDYNPKSK